MLDMQALHLLDTSQLIWNDNINFSAFNDIYVNQT